MALCEVYGKSITSLFEMTFMTYLAAPLPKQASAHQLQVKLKINEMQKANIYSDANLRMTKPCLPFTADTTHCIY